MKKRIGYITSDVSGAVSFYRLLGPIRQIERIQDEIEFIHISKICWSEYTKLDAVVMHRCCTKDDLLVMQMAHFAKIPLLVDYDDNIMAIPKDNPAYDQYSKIDHLEDNIKYALSIADYITVSTPAMEKALKKLTDKTIHVIPNAFNEDFVKREVSKRSKTILWRGSGTHINDLLQAKKDVEYLVSKYPEHEWLFMGQRPWMFEGIIKKMHYLSGVEPYRYFCMIQEIAPEFMFVPLIDSEFNRAKSNISYLEGSFAGAKVIASNLPEFDVPGCGTFKNGELENYMSVPSVEEAWDYIEKNLTLKIVNQKRHDLFREMCGVSEK